MGSFGWAPAPSDCVPPYRGNVDAWTGTQGELQAERRAEVRMMLRTLEIASKQTSWILRYISGGQAAPFGYFVTAALVG